MSPPPKKALLLAAGLGTRLHPLTLVRPKPMMPLWGTPLLEHALRLLESWGVEEVAVNAHWKPEVIGVWLRSRGRNKTRWSFEHNRHTEHIWYKDKPMRVRVSHEPEILGTGGALVPLRDFLGGGSFWVMNADIAASLDPGPLLEAFELGVRSEELGVGSEELGVGGGCLAAAWMEPRRGPRTVEMDRKGRVTCWRSPTPGVEHTYTFCGLQVVSPRIFDFIPDGGGAFSIVDVYERAMGQGVFVRGVEVPGSYWDDAGTVEAYLRIHGEVKRLAAAGKRGGELYDAEIDRHAASAKTFFCVGEGQAKVADDAEGVNSVVYDFNYSGAPEVQAGSKLKGCVIAGGKVGGVLDGVVCVSPGDEGVVRAVEAMGWAMEQTAVMFCGRRGSDRSFWMLRNGDQSLVYIYYSLTRTENARYAGHAKVLAGAGVPVPKVLVDLPESQCLMLEDLGNDSLQQRMRRKRGGNVESWYRSVIEAMARLHREGTAAVLEGGMELEPPFGDTLYAWERGLFEEHLLKARYGLEGLPGGVVAELEAVAARLEGGRQVLVHRDFQSSNVLFRKGGGPVLIDFQGMRFGAGAYDLASLLYDPYVTLDDSLRGRLAVSYGTCFPENTDALALLREGAVQRLVQALGAFGRLGGDFARHVPQGLANLLEVSDALGLDALRDLVEELITREKMRI